MAWKGHCHTVVPVYLIYSKCSSIPWVMAPISVKSTKYMLNWWNTASAGQTYWMQDRMIKYWLYQANTGLNTGWMDWIFNLDLLVSSCFVFDTFDIIWSVQAVSCSSSYNVPFKQSLIHSTCTWLLQPVHDWFDLYWIYYSRNWSAFSIYQV